MVDDDLKTTVREFRTSVATDLEVLHQRIDEMSDEVRRRITTAETAILAEIRDQGRRVERRIERVEARVDDLESGSGDS
jgi:hypothetical protein